LEYISNAVQKDMKFRNSLKGMIMGQFTLEEYNLYIQNSSALNKRMMNMVIKRIQDQLQYFEQPALINQWFPIEIGGEDVAHKVKIGSYDLKGPIYVR